MRQLFTKHFLGNVSLPGLEKLRKVGRAVSIPTFYDGSSLIFPKLTLSSCDLGGAELDLANQSTFSI